MAKKTKQSSNDEQFVEPSNAVRLCLVLLTGAGLLSLHLLTKYLDSLMPEINDGAEGLVNTIASLVTFLDYLIILSLFMSLLVSAYFLNYASKIKRSGRVPPPDSSVIAKTRIRRGKQARLVMNFSYVLAFLAWLPLAAALYIKWILDAFT